MSHKLRVAVVSLVVAVWLGWSGGAAWAADAPAGYELKSPDGKIVIAVRAGERLTYAVSADGRELLAPSPISMTVSGGDVLGPGAKVTGAATRTVDEVVTPVVPVKRRQIRDHYNALVLKFDKNFGVEFRAYDDGAAYRFVTALPGEITVKGEEVAYHFAGDFGVFFPEEESFQSHNERLYKYLAVKEIAGKRFASLPVLVDTRAGTKIAISESDLDDYPGLWLKGTGGNALAGTFPAVVLEENMKNDRDSVVTKRAEYIARTTGSRAFPWRLMAISRSDEQLLSNQLPYLLGRAPAAGEDFSWVRPGKVAWDWWNDNNVYGVDFRAGVNTATYKYYIDFAAKNGLEYVILDEGWYKLGNLLELEKDVDMDAIAAYARERKVGLILWVVWKTLEDQLEPALARFEKWGVRGIKVDFMARDDQWMVNYYWRIARAAAARRMLVDFHGAFKPAGLYRTYPNVISNEGVKGLENCKWGADITPGHDVTLPFIRMWAGPMDFTPGAMLNATKKDFKAVFNTPMSQGTRAHQVAMYGVFESPLQMLADSPTHYQREPECLAFIAKVPAVWDETVPLPSKVGEYVAVARKSGDRWFVGAMTDWSAREMTIDFSFLDAGRTYAAEILQDGPNADRNANDYQRVTRTVSKGDKITVKLAPGGGWTCRLE